MDRLDMAKTMNRPRSATDLEHLALSPSINLDDLTSEDHIFQQPSNGCTASGFVPEVKEDSMSLNTSSAAAAARERAGTGSNVSRSPSSMRRPLRLPAASRSRLMGVSEWAGMSTRLPGRSLEEGDMPTLTDVTIPAGRNLRSVSDPFIPNPTADRISTTFSPRLRKMKLQQQQVLRIFDDPIVTAGYASVPPLEQNELPRGGVSVNTAAVGRVQFGIPPETIKDSMLLGLEVPRYYIVPRERFCSDWGPALGINLAEFEFPAYFNYFVRQKKCCLVVDSHEAEINIRSVFEETLLGPKHFRDHSAPLANDDEDFDPDYPLDMRPNFYEEFQHFRAAEKTLEYDELNTDMLLDFCHFEKGRGDAAGSGADTPRTVRSSILPSLPRSTANDRIGIPPIPTDLEIDEEEDEDGGLTLKGMMADDSERVAVFSRSSESWCKSPLLDMDSSHRQARFSERQIDSGSNRPMEGSSHRQQRRTSLESVQSLFSAASGNTLGSMRSDVTTNQQNWMFSQVQWLGEVATLWPSDATPQQIQDRSVPRVEIFKMPGNGTEYVIHDVDANNFIVGKARLRGSVRVPDEIAVEGFLSEPTMESSPENEGRTLDDHSSMDDDSVPEEIAKSVPRRMPKALFHPPSFGVTVLGNSHGFDKNGSTSGYVLWVNGRGIMIDPPPYSSATLEREGIRPQMIFGVMITHCHADHDAGAFQKVLTGSRLTLITTPSIYKSFIRKYSALSGLSPTLLQHSHRYRSAVIGTPLKFQGATFHFTYTLHTIPCISFKVEWRGRSMVFTGDHLNLPSLMDTLEQKGVLSKGRADCLRQMPLQDCDLLLHEAGAPPIHTPLTVLQSLPEHIKARLYVVHTSALPANCGLRVAPTGTSGTIRLDEIKPSHNRSLENGDHSSTNGRVGNGSNQSGVMNRPACISDAWFVLNLISNIPFFASLSYLSTMEVLEVASIDVYLAGEVVVPARKRMGTLCVVWEGTCTERESDASIGFSTGAAVWHAGDWTAPIILQPNADQAANFSEGEPEKDVIALSEQGVKVIKISMKELNKILMRGSKLYRKYAGIEDIHGHDWIDTNNVSDAKEETPQSRHVLDVIKINSLLGNLYAGQIRSLESIAVGPRVFEPGTYLWKAGSGCDFAFLITMGSASFCSLAGRRRSLGYGRSSLGHSSSRNVMEVEGGHVIEVDKMLHDLPPESEFARLDLLMALREARMAEDPDYRSPNRTGRNSKQMLSDRNANKVFARLYSSRKAIDGLVVSRGCFLCDTSKMVAGELVHETGGTSSQHLHSTSLVTGGAGCTAWVFPRSTLMPFLEANPGILLSLLGTQVVV